MARYTTLQDIDRAGLDLRIACYQCGHIARADPAWVAQRFAVRHWPLDLPFARQRLRCAECRTRGALILPATPRPTIGNPAEQVVATFFHLSRQLAKRPPESPAIERVIEMMKAKSRNSDLE